MDEPDVCDFMAGNTEVPALPGYVDAPEVARAQHRRWFAYGLPDPTARKAAAEALTGELGIPFAPDDILLTRGAHGAMAFAMAMVLDPDDEVVFVSPPWFFYEALIEDDVAFVRGLAKDKVLVAPGTMFEMPGYFRLSLTATDEMVDRAIPVFERAIHEAARGGRPTGDVDRAEATGGGRGPAAP